MNVNLDEYGPVLKAALEATEGDYAAMQYINCIIDNFSTEDVLLFIKGAPRKITGGLDIIDDFETYKKSHQSLQVDCVLIKYATGIIDSVKRNDDNTPSYSADAVVLTTT